MMFQVCSLFSLRVDGLGGVNGWVPRNKAATLARWVCAASGEPNICTLKNYRADIDFCLDTNHLKLKLGRLV